MLMGPNPQIPEESAVFKTTEPSIAGLADFAKQKIAKMEMYVEKLMRNDTSCMMNNELPH
jgi:hypothetical protein